MAVITDALPDADAGFRPPSAQDLLLNFFGAYVLVPAEEDPAAEPDVPTAAAIAICQGAGIGESAVRATLNRMVARDLLCRRRTGRTTAYRLTGRSRRVLREGERRVNRVGAVRDDVETRWVLLGFNMPTAAQRERHVLRSRLTWAGFGLLQNGLWIAPAPVDLSVFLEDAEIAPFLRIFSADAHPATDLAALAPSIWNLDALDNAYRSFIRRWEGGPGDDWADPLTQVLVLNHHWLELVRRDPVLPRWCLPADWPAERAQAVFRRALSPISAGAARMATRLLAQPSGARIA
jgi:DNA-binding transcriptional regulator PaaX